MFKCDFLPFHFHLEQFCKGTELRTVMEMSILWPQPGQREFPSHIVLSYNYQLHDDLKLKGFIQSWAQKFPDESPASPKVEMSAQPAIEHSESRMINMSWFIQTEDRILSWNYLLHRVHERVPWEWAWLQKWATWNSFRFSLKIR